jgi:hypothetical protein
MYVSQLPLGLDDELLQQQKYAVIQPAFNVLSTGLTG